MIIMALLNNIGENIIVNTLLTEQSVSQNEEEVTTSIMMVVHINDIL
jgi:hypothetical protein